MNAEEINNARKALGIFTQPAAETARQTATGFVYGVHKWRGMSPAFMQAQVGKLATLIERAALSREREAVRKCARAMCLQCRQEIPVTQYGNHETNEFYQTCAASPIRVLYPEHFKED